MIRPATSTERHATAITRRSQPKRRAAAIDHRSATSDTQPPSPADHNQGVAPP
jgi:hypothetical protein